MPRFRAAASTLLTVALVTLGLGSCGRESEPSIVLISIDTLRSDRLPAYGYRGISTPHMDSLRQDSILFERAYSPTPTTLPAHATMLTGLLPPDHGVRGNVGYSLDTENLPYLPRRLSEAGYATGAAVASFVMRGETGLARGFDLYEDDIDYRAGAGSAGMQRTGSETVEAVLPWLRSVADEPFFLFLHLYDTHSPFTPQEPYASRYESPYDAEVAAVDEVIGRLVSELELLGLYDQTAIILTSDHGEGLGDHGEAEHGIFVYREAIQVPLLLKLPGGERAGGSVEVAAQLADIYPTILELAGSSAGDDAVGRSLVQLGPADAQRQIYSETYYPRFYFGWSELISVIEGRHHFIDSPDPELFDLASDPGETRNLIETDLDTTRRLRRLTQAYEPKLVQPEDTDLDTWSRMASLGYVGHGQTRIEAELPSAASQVHLLGTIRTGLLAAQRGNHAAAVGVLAQVVGENPFALVAWEQLGRSFERLGRFDDARRSYLRALEISADAPHLVLAAARTSLRASVPGQAAELATRALAWDEAGARTLLGEIALEREDLDEAERQSRLAIELRTPNSAAMFTLAQVQLRRGEFDAALETTRLNRESVGRPVQRLELLRANILASMGRFEEAEAALRREIELFPSAVAAYPRLAVLLARHGRPDEAIETVRRLVDTHPNPAGYSAAARAFELLGDPRSAQALRDEARRRFAQPAPRESSEESSG